MAGKNVTSKDPRKPGIVAALKALSKGRKVTLLKEVSPGVFEGHCLGDKVGHSFTALGCFQVREVKNGTGVVTHYVPAVPTLMTAAAMMGSLIVVSVGG